MRRPLVIAGSAIAVLIGCVAFGSAPAAAHATLERAEPAADARLAGEPRRVVLGFDEPVNLELGHVTVFGPRGTSVSGPPAQSDGGRTITVALTSGAGDGTYVVSYRLVSLDTHPVSGGFYFQVGSGPVAANAPAAASTGADDPTVRALYAASRYAAFIGLLLLTGGVLFLVVGWTDLRTAARTEQQAWWGLGLIAAGSIGELLLQAPYAAGTPLSGITGTAVGHVVDTSFGTAHLVRLALVAIAAPILTALRRSGVGIGSRALRAAVASLVLAFVITWASYGHAATIHPLIAVPSDVLHLVAVAVWVGGLTALATAVLPSATEAQLRAILPRWSLLAMACVLALVLSGTVQALLEVEGWSGLADTTYGRLLLAKIALLVAVLLVANFSRRWVARWYSARGRTRVDPTTRMRDATARAVGSLRRAVATESLLAVAAVAVAAVLVEADPGQLAEVPAFASSGGSGARQPVITRHGAYVATAQRGDVVLHLKVDPAVVGVQYIYLDATRPDGRRVAVQRWGLALSNASLGLRNVPVPVLVDSGIGHHFVYGSFTMKTGGVWTVRVTARSADGEETVMTRRVAVRS